MIRTPIIQALRTNWFRAMVARDLEYTMPEASPTTERGAEIASKVDKAASYKKYLFEDIPPTREYTEMEMAKDLNPVFTNFSADADAFMQKTDE
jgi:hypothetical protein